ncbi:MAG: CoA transferase [Acidobacteria bacterium]|nr:CoA transferase [Acidobacteriota bacterium]
MTYSLLQGLRVVELGESVSAPYCAKLLADMGAEVVKIERPGVGDQAREYGPFLNDQPHHERSGLFLYLNTNKQGVTLDLETPTGQEILGGLLAQSQVFVHNLHPTEMDRLGVDYENLRTHNGQLVMASITPFGLTGPYRDYKAYDINLAAAGGICEGLGSPDREPLTFGTPEVGYFAAMAAATFLITSNMPTRLTPMVNLNTSRSNNTPSRDTTLCAGATPAAFTSTSMDPKASRAPETAPLTSSGLDTSQGINRDFSPRSSTASLPRSSFMSSMTTEAP